MNAKSAITEILHGNSYNYGSYKYEDGSIYTGQWDSKGLRHGIGKLQFDEDKKNCYYEGQFKRGMPEGLGMLKTPYFVMQGQFKQASQISLFNFLHYISIPSHPPPPSVSRPLQN